MSEKQNSSNMEMYSKRLSEAASMLRGSNIPVDPPSLSQNPEVNRIRKLLLTLIGIELVLFLINFLFIIHSYAASDSLESQWPNSSSQLVLIIASLIYYGYGFVVSHRYYQTGLFVFVLLGLIIFVLTNIIVSKLLIRIVNTASDVGFVTAGIIVAIIFDTICILSLILQMFLVLYAFQLYRLLKKNKHLTIEQI